ncbi:MAG TPA: hypothetical protein VG650_04450 [Mycobacteriales bacterium]|nr:hypothetical protein [Mycobacteriales bacterium]
MASARAVSVSATEPERVEVTPSVGFAWLVEGIRPYLGYVFIAAGLIALFIGWWGVSGTALVAKQLPYIASAGLVGVVLVAIGNRIFMTNDLRRDSGRLDRLEQMVAELHAVLLARTDAVADAAPAAAAAGKPYRAVPRGTSYHLPDCSMVQGKETVGISRGEVSSRNLKACRMCHPDAA